MVARYTTLKELVEAVRSGEIDESKLQVVMDNDCSHVCIPHSNPEEEGEELYNGKGYYDVEDLWPLVFPKATVEWC